MLHDMDEDDCEPDVVRAKRGRPAKRSDGRHPWQRPVGAFHQSDKAAASNVTPDWALDPSLLPKKPPGRK